MATHNENLSPIARDGARCCSLGTFRCRMFGSGAPLECHSPLSPMKLVIWEFEYIPMPSPDDSGWKSWAGVCESEQDLVVYR